MSSGIRCGSPAQRGQKHCFYHTSIRTLLPKRFIGHENFRNEYEHGCRLFPMPLLEDATSIQTALMQVIHAALEGAIHFRSASIVLSALRTAQRNLALVKLEMAATSAAAVQRELPSDARQKAEMTWPNRADDQWPTSYIGEATVLPRPSQWRLGYREPKIPPEGEDEAALGAATPQADPSSRHSTVQARRHSRPTPGAAVAPPGRSAADRSIVAGKCPSSSDASSAKIAPNDAAGPTLLARGWRERGHEVDAAPTPAANSHCHSHPAAYANSRSQGRKGTRKPSAQTEKEGRPGGVTSLQQTLHVCHPERATTGSRDQG